jgi:hypothetical protein
MSINQGKFGDREKKNKARKEVMNKLPQPVGIEDLSFPDVFGQEQEEFGNYEQPEKEPMSENVADWVNEDVPDKKKSFFAYRDEPKKPVMDEKKKEQLRKAQLAQGIAKALGSVHKLSIRNNGGIAGRDSGQVDEFINNQIQFLDDDYLRQMSDYNEQLERTQVYNNNLSNRESELGLAAQQQAGQMDARQKQFDSELDYKKGRDKADDDFRNKGLALREKEYGLSYDRAAQQASQLNNNQLKDQATTLTNQAKELNDQIEFELGQIEVDDKKVRELEAQRGNLAARIEAVNDRYNKVNGVDIPEPEQQAAPNPYTPGGSIMDAARRQPTMQETKINQQAIDEPASQKKESAKLKEAETAFNDMIAEAKSGSVSKDQYDYLVKAAQDFARRSGKGFDKTAFKDWLEKQGVKEPTAKDDSRSFRENIVGAVRGEGWDNQ